MGYRNESVTGELVWASVIDGSMTAYSHMNPGSNRGHVGSLLSARAPPNNPI